MLHEQKTTALLTIWLALAAVTGCEDMNPPAQKPEPKLSYAEALQIHNQELIALDRLLEERERLQQSLQTQPMDLVENLLGQAGQAKAELQKTLDEIGDPSGLLDSAAEGGQDDPLAALGQQLQEANQQRADQRADIEARIAELDEEIAAQRERVARAEADKNKAEAARDQ